MRAELIVYNARLATCDPSRARARALATWKGRVFAVGSDDEIRELAGPGTKVVDLGGRFVCPGFTDCHTHLTQWALLASGRTVNLEGARSLEEALGRVAEAVPKVPRGRWLRGRGWDRNRWPGQEFPTAADLDRVTGDIPAAFPNHDGHSLWVNSEALRRAGITDAVTDPPAGRVLRLADGRPSGVFQEGAMGLVWPQVPSPTLEELVTALREAMPVAASLGLTGLHNVESGDTMRAVQALRDSGGLSLRIVRYPPTSSLTALIEQGFASGFGDEEVRLGGIKAFLDGALGSRTAAMLEPYENSSDTGVLVMQPEELTELVARATEGGLAVALHAIGDRAVRIGLDAFASAKEEHVGRWPRHRIEHAQHIHPDDQPRFAQIGIIASVQPVHMLADIATCEKQIGERGKWAFPLQSLRRLGTHLAMGSDAPVEIIDPLAGIRSALLRQGHDGSPEGGWYPEEKLTAQQALSGYTLETAYASGEEHLKGSLEPGKVADFVVLSHDLLTTPAEELAEVQVMATVMGGKPVYDPEGLLD
jgi:predicted amidohydrolase YtcJ